MIADAIEAGGSSLRDYVQADGSLGYFQHSFSVYDREGEPCRDAGLRRPCRAHRAERRSTFYCRGLPALEVRDGALCQIQEEAADGL